MARLAYKVFVYGTLQRGQPNYYRLQDEARGYARFLGEAILCDKYPLVVATKFNIPMLLDQPGIGKEVHGEIFEVDERMLQHLDQLEDHPNLYLRCTRKCKFMKLDEKSTEENSIDNTNGIVDCEVYLMPDFKRTLLDLPFLSHYNIEAGRQFDLKVDVDGVGDYDLFGDLKEQK